MRNYNVLKSRIHDNFRQNYRGIEQIQFRGTAESAERILVDPGPKQIMAPGHSWPILAPGNFRPQPIMAPVSGIGNSQPAVTPESESFLGFSKSWLRVKFPALVIPGSSIGYSRPSNSAKSPGITTFINRGFTIICGGIIAVERIQVDPVPSASHGSGSFPAPA